MESIYCRPNRYTVYLSILWTDKQYDTSTYIENISILYGLVHIQYENISILYGLVHIQYENISIIYGHIQFQNLDILYEPKYIYSLNTQINVRYENINIQYEDIKHRV